MSAQPVGALAVDETFAQMLVFVANAFGADSREAQQVREARAAVAEMIAAADEGAVMKTADGRETLYFSPGKAARLIAALARIGGTP
jgi:hypothetical protein